MKMSRLVLGSSALASLGLGLGLTSFAEAPTSTRPEDLQIDSPDGTLTLTFALGADSSLTYALAQNGEPLISPSALGFSESELGELRGGFVLEEASSGSGRETYDLLWGETAKVDAPFRENEVRISHPASGAKFTVRARLFDDGLGFRYEFPEMDGRDSLRVLEEHSGFRVSGDPTVNWGPGDWNSYENRLELTKRSAIDAAKYDNAREMIGRNVPNNAIMTPASMRLDGGTHLSIHEAALVDYPEMTLGLTDDGFESILVGTRRREAKAVRALPFTSPWRVVLVENRAIDLLDNHLILNLNPDSGLDSLPWFTPQTYAGVWWAMFLGQGTWDLASSQTASGGGDLVDAPDAPGGSRHAANTANVKRYIDFCADNNIGGLLVEGWNTGWEVWTDPVKREEVFDFVTPYPDYDLREVVAYGKSKGVDIVMHHETSASVPQYEKQQDTAFALMRELGLHIVKSGYVGNILPEGEYHHGQYMVNHYRKTLEKALTYEVAVNAHEPIKATGERRTLPNAISREGARGQEYNAFGDTSAVNQPSHVPSLVYTRCLSGPFDYTPGIFNLEMTGFKSDDDEVLSTIAQQLGIYVLIYAPIQMVADIPENYRIGADSTGYHPAMAFIRTLATDWERTIPIDGELGEFAVLARQERGADRYFVGGVTGDTARTVTIALDFLPAGRDYALTLYRDGDAAHYRTNKTDVAIETRTVSRTDSLTVRMVKAGGFAGVLE